MADQTNRQTATEAEDVLEKEEEVPLCQHDDYDADLSLPDREARWGFTLSELQSAVKVVRVLFCNPALYVGDPYLSDSRLCTMITRDRKTKRENREVFKAIMSEEKSRRKRYQRLQDMKAVCRTAMKRERDDALNNLLLTGRDGATLNLQPLLIRDRPHAPQPCAPNAAAASPLSADATTSTPDATPETIVLTAQEKEVLRLAGAFENMLRLEEALRGVPVEGYTPGVGDDAAPPPPPSTDNPPVTGGIGAPAPSTSASSRVKKMSGEATGSNRHETPTPPVAGLDWTVITQLTAQVYRYLPPLYGSQMPPPLFAGAVPPNVMESPMVVRSFVRGMKCHVAQRAAALVHLASSLSEAPEAAAVAAAATAATTPHRQRETNESISEVPLHDALRTTGRDVIVRTPLAELQSIAGLRALVGGAAEVATSSTSVSATTTASSSSPVKAVVEEPLDDVLRAIELVLLEGKSDDRFDPAGPATRTTTTTTTDAEASTQEDGTRASQLRIAEQSLHCFIARRLYASARLRSCGTSPVLIQRSPPTSNSEEPDGYCIYDDVQRYAVEHHEDDEQLKLNKWIGCHTCRVRYNRLHPYYYSMCHLCGEYNYNKRLMARDLRGKTVLLTGCRIKIGYAMALSLLRCGATVLGTTRFIHEAVARFQQEVDYGVWKSRLHLFSLDLRDMWVVTQFSAFVRQKYKKLFAIINNAAQTIARTPQYTEHLRHIELNPPADLQAGIQQDTLSAEWHNFFCHHTTVTVGQAMSIEYHPSTQPFLDSDQLSRYSDGDEEQKGMPRAPPPQSGNATSGDDTAVPPSTRRTASGEDNDNSTAVALRVACDRTLIFDRYDTQAEESDHRDKNSWVMNLAEVQGSEAAEVMAINALSPFILNGKLKVCLTDRDGDATPNEPRFIVNVSAMEGQFYRFKQTTHPHTNMAKAALNMMTRTSGDDYAVDGIYMNSVDTGWITDESPKLKKDRRAEQFMLCPLDEVDAAARCLDLIYTNSRVYGKFYKDFKEIAW
ncbi:oxidoreductase-like protein [Leptomonas pyrrhocoris]|uniref:Oxidoreductase-like protein n=1 Tax=Leptomonas pyrrhocoris TaxID=157538 RepID=A0A0N0DZL6_LEPPY|nr:oxidoreductase-like protein [Leptomonas pyrrhocoris]KPA85435.1 oxidoreductase-like protein [Leptomonas pyrrhocoris]|eukprot:XP_015663874.1 oxidoreductase-like protein [Leptomonas pyrrhocoris]